MAEPMSFSFTVPRAEGPLVELSFDEAEKRLLRRLEDERDHPEESIWQLVLLYSQAGRQDVAETYLRRLIDRGGADPETRGAQLLALGQLGEQRSDFEGASSYYRLGLACEPEAPDTSFFLRNNLGYCLNVLGQHAEAEQLCRAAIRIQPNRPNGHKNLGIALAAQGRVDDAARAFVDAVRANAADPRALRHLEELLAKHPDIATRVPEVGERLENCRKAVEVAAALQRATAPRVHRGAAKWWFLFVGDLRRLWSRWFGRKGT